MLQHSWSPGIFCIFEILLFSGESFMVIFLNESPVVKRLALELKKFSTYHDLIISSFNKTFSKEKSNIGKMLSGYSKRILCVVIVGLKVI